MGLVSGVAFWLMAGIMWVMATPTVVSVVNSSGLSGVELFLMQLVPWAVLLAIFGRLLYAIRGAGQ